MELSESVNELNRQLIDLFGIDTINGLSIWRVVWSDDQTEKRLTDFTDSGIQLLRPEVREMPKYQWNQHRFILERLILIPDFQQNELPTQKLSYEPIFTFETKRGEYLPPRLDVAKMVIDTVYAAQGKGSLAKYNDPDVELDAQKKRVDSICEYLYGDETAVSDAFAHGEAITDFHQKIKES